MAQDEPSPDASKTLLERWQKEGDVDALDELLRLEVGALSERLRARGRGLLRASASASDLVQEAVMRMLRLDDAPEFREPNELRAYLWTAAWRLLLNRKGAHARGVVPLSQAQSAELVLAIDGGTSQAEREERVAALNVVMNLLRDEDREVLALVYFEHVTIEELARRLGIRRPAADMRLSRARRRLAEKMVAWSGVVA